jgi:hypothetical protein
MSLTSTKKKALILTIAGAFAFTGVGISFMQNISAAAATEHTKVHHAQPPKMDRDQQLTEMASALGIEKADLVDFLSKGNDLHDLHMAVNIADASQKPWKTVLASKTAANSWQDVCQSYGVTEDQLHESEQNHMSKMIAGKIDLNQTTVSNLLKNGYHPRDVMMAGLLAKKADKDIQTVLDAKKINNRWEDVAAGFNISKDDFAADTKDFRCAMPGNHDFLDKGPHHRMHQADDQMTSNPDTDESASQE